MKTGHIVGLIANIREKTNRFIIQELRKRDIEGLGPSHGDILINLYQHDGLPMAELAKKIHRDKSTITTLVDKLAAAGYVKRVKDPNDRRITYICLTEKGKALKTGFYEISQELLERIYTGFSDLEKELVVRLLERMLKNW